MTPTTLLPSETVTTSASGATYAQPAPQNRCIYRGRLEALPTPTHMPSAEEGEEAMYRDGFVQFPDLLSPTEVREMRAWMDRSGEPDSAYDMKDWCFNKHLEADLTSDTTWLPLIARTPVVNILERVLGKDFTCYGAGMWITGQGREMNIHADFLLLEVPGNLLAEAKVRLPVIRSSLHIYFDDQVEEIGTTLVIPGSHLAGRLPNQESTWNGITPKMVSVKAGGAVLFRHDVWHGAAKNTSTRRRYMIQVHYAIRWHHAPAATITPRPLYQPAFLAQATPEQRRVLG